MLVLFCYKLLTGLKQGFVSSYSVLFTNEYNTLLTYQILYTTKSSFNFQVVRGTLNPEFEETFEFIVPREEFESR